MEQAYKGVFFDAINTLVALVPSFAAAFARVCRDNGYEVAEEQVEKIFPLIERIELQRLRTAENLAVSQQQLIERWVNMNSFIFQQLGIDADARRLALEMEKRIESAEFTRLFPDTIVTLQTLKASDFRLAIISNGTAGLKACLERLRLPKYLDLIFISALVGWEKPSPQIFNMALDKIGLEPEQTIHVGDHYFVDILGAQQVGIKGILLNRDNKPHHYPCQQISSLLELLELLNLR